jgi:hypothetical protein
VNPRKGQPGAGRERWGGRIGRGPRGAAQDRWCTGRLPRTRR